MSPGHYGSHVTARTITREELEQEVLGTFLQQAVSATQVIPIPSESPNLPVPSSEVMARSRSSTRNDSRLNITDITAGARQNGIQKMGKIVAIIAGCLMLIVVAMTILVTVEITGRRSDSSSIQTTGIAMHGPTITPTQSPKAAQTSQPTRLELNLYDLTLQHFLESYSWWETKGKSSLSNPSSPQFQALLWLSKEDDMFAQLVQFATQNLQDFGNGLNDFDDRDGQAPSAASSNSTTVVWEPLLNALRLEEARVLQRYAMATIYFSTGGDSWRNNANWLSRLNVCEWYSATHVPPCDDAIETEDYQPNKYKAGTVSRLELGGLGLRGTLPNEIVLLMEYAELETIGLANNELHGTMPAAWGGRGGHDNSVGETATLARKRSILRRLDLSNNQLSGTIPVQWIDKSSSTGASSGGFLIHHSLEVLSLGGNHHLSGDVSEVLWQLTSLQHVDLSDLPDASLTLSSDNVRQLTKMKSFHVSRGLKLMGSLPTELGLWSNLVELNLRTIPNTGDDDPLSLFRTSIPTELWQLSNLQLIDLSGLLLSGTFPSVGNLVALEKAYLGGNRLTGTIPPTIGSWTDLRELDLSSNPTLGRDSNLPTDIAKLTSLRKLNLSNCAFSGHLFSEIGHLVALQELSMRNNYLMSGSVISELGRLTELEELDLANCSISGRIPTELGALFKLKKLHLGGHLNDGASNAKNDNDESSIGLTGTIPDEFKNMKQLQRLHLDHNQLTGPLPEYTIASMAKLQVLHFQSNQFSSTIPPRWATALSEMSKFVSELTCDRRLLPSLHAPTMRFHVVLSFS